MPGSKTRVTKSMLVRDEIVGAGMEGGVSPRILELQRKIQDDNYLEYAIDRIAVIMSRHIVDNKSVTGNTADFLTM